MRTLAILASAWFASACLTTTAAADCGWSNDADMANALSDSHWQITTLRGMEVAEPPGSDMWQVSLVPEMLTLDLTIGPALKDNLLGERDVTVTLFPPSDAVGAELTIGNSTFNTPFPSLADTQCATADLSALRIATDARWALDTWVMLRAASPDRLIGILKIAGPYATNGVGAAIYLVEATPGPSP